MSTTGLPVASKAFNNLFCAAGMSKFVDVLGLDMTFVREKLHFLREEHLVQNMGASGHSITRKGREYLESRHI